MSTQPPPSPLPPPPPGSSDPTHLLDHYEKALAAVRAGLVDLETTPSFLMLNDDGLSGETKSVLGSAAKRAALLWPLIITVDQRLDEARSLASGDSAFNRSKTRELAELLASPLPTTDSAELSGTTLTLPIAINEIRTRYSAIRDGASDIEALWLSVLPRIDAAKSTLDSLDAAAKKLGVVEPLIGRARTLAQDLESRLVSDPLSVHGADGSNLDSKVAEAVAQISHMQTGRRDLATDLAEAQVLLAGLRTLNSRAAANRAESASKVVDPQGLVHTPSPAIFDHESRGLAAQLDRVLDAGNNWSAQRTLLDSWLASARALEKQLFHAEDKNGAPILARQALRGRLRAYEAKMAAVGLAEDLDLTDLVDSIRDELFRAPTNLETARGLINELAERLRGDD